MVKPLEEENRELREQVKALSLSLTEVQGEIRQMNTCSAEENKALLMLLEQLEQNTQSYNILSQTCDVLLRGYGLIRETVNNLKYELRDPEGLEEGLFYPRFRSNEDTLRLIIEEGKSLARFGDGEFSILFKSPRHKFQKPDENLAQRIRQVLSSSHPGLLIGIAKNYGNLDRYCDSAANGIRHYMTNEVRCAHMQVLSPERVYSDAYITRPYVIYKDVFTEEPRKRFDALKGIWKDKKIMIVEGAQTRLGVGNDLFDQAAFLRRILAPATNSFDRYDDILKECLKYADEVELFVLAIGPSSGVLAYDLTNEGCQAVDVGHIDLEYEWFLAGKGVRVPVPYKYNNEMDQGDLVEEIDNPLYEASVVAVL